MSAQNENKLAGDDAVARAVQSALLPIASAVWNAHTARELLNREVALRMKGTPAADILAPIPNIGGPAIEALRYFTHEPLLSNLFVNLLATAMNRVSASIAHPAFVDIIRQLSVDEARLLELFVQDLPLALINLRWEFRAASEGKTGGKEVLVNFSHMGTQAGCEFPLLTATYIDNLCRLGLCDMPAFYHYTSPHVYDAIESDPIVASLVADIESEPERIAMIERKGLRVTALGRQFIRACLVTTH